MIVKVLNTSILLKIYKLRLDQLLNLAVAYFEEKKCANLPQIYPQDFADFFIRNHLRFLDDVFRKWLMQFNSQDFYKITNELDPDLQFIFEELTKNINFLNIILKINNKLHFDVYHKTKNSFRYLHYKSYPPHTKINIALSLARCIVRVVTDNTNNWSSGHLLKRKHPEKIIDNCFTKLFQPRKHGHNHKNVITFTRTYNPNHHFSFNKFKIAIKTLEIENFKKHLMIKKYSLLHDNQRN